MIDAQRIAARIVKALSETGGCQVNKGAEYGHITPEGQRTIERILKEELPKVEAEGKYNSEYRLAQSQAAERRQWEQERNRRQGR